MRHRFAPAFLASTLAACLLAAAPHGLPPLTAADPLNIGSRRELFVDESLLDRTAGKIALRLHSPVPREIAFRYDRPWEGNASGYPTVFQDGDRYRMYYRGHRFVVADPPLRQAQTETVCYAESRDGIVWTRPSLGLHAWNGSKDNNILWMGSPEAHNFSPLLDTNPACPPEARYKAIGGTVASQGLWTFQSADGLHWTRLSDRPVVTQGAFDSHNTAFWDAERRRYSLYVRYFSESEFKGLRLIGVCHSADFQTWTAPEPLVYPGSPPQQMYTNQIAPYTRAPHLLLGFPTRYVARPLTPHLAALPPVELRTRLTELDRRVGTDLSEGLFMASRDGRTFRRWDEAFLRPGPEREERWIYGDNYQSYGLWQARSPDGALAPELSLHFNEHAWRDDSHQVRRYTIRLDGFVSLNAPLAGGEAVTPPLVFTGRKLRVNYATSAAGELRVEIQTADGTPVDGYKLDDSVEHFGDRVDQVVTWKQGDDVGKLAGRPVRLRFALKDADVYSFQFGE